MKIQELMMKKLSLPTLEEVEQSCPKTSSYKALEEFFIVFREWVCVFVLLIDFFVVVFPNHIDHCRNRLAPKRQVTVMKESQAPSLHI